VKRKGAAGEVMKDGGWNAGASANWMM